MTDTLSPPRIRRPLCLRDRLAQDGVEAGRGVGGARTRRKSSYSASSSEYIARSTPGSRPRTRINDDYVHCLRGCARGGRVLAGGLGDRAGGYRRGRSFEGPRARGDDGLLWRAFLLPTTSFILLSPLLFTGVHPTVVVLGSPLLRLRPQNWFLQEIRPITTYSPPAHSYPLDSSCYFYLSPLLACSRAIHSAKNIK